MLIRPCLAGSLPDCRTGGSKPRWATRWRGVLKRVTSPIAASSATAVTALPPESVISRSASSPLSASAAMIVSSCASTFASILSVFARRDVSRTALGFASTTRRTCGSRIRAIANAVAVAAIATSSLGVKLARTARAPSEPLRPAWRHARRRPRRSRSRSSTTSSYDDASSSAGAQPLPPWGSDASRSPFSDSESASMRTNIAMKAPVMSMSSQTIISPPAI